MAATISDHVKDFYQKKSVLSLFKAVYLIFKEGRIIELLYGFYCFLFFKPSKVYGNRKDEKYFKDLVDELLSRKYHGFRGLIYDDYLKENFGNEYPYHLIPDDFRTRMPSILKINDWLLLGEYGDASGRLCILTRNGIKMIDSYNKIKGFRHIHLIHKYGEDKVFIATGDDKKYLDIWIIKDENIEFSKRLIKVFGGFTSAVTVGDEFYFGSDFSQRPNYIYRLSDKKKFFFPKDSYVMFVMYFELIEDRYIISLNRTTVNFGGKSVSVFDTKTEKFVYSKKLTI